MKLPRSMASLALVAAAVFFSFGVLVRLLSYSSTSSVQLQKLVNAIPETQLQIQKLERRIVSLEGANLVAVERSKLKVDVAMAVADSSHHLAPLHVDQQQKRSEDTYKAEVNASAMRSVLECATAKLPDGPPARTEEEVIAKSKLDKQYYNGIAKTADAKHLVDSKDYWEKRYAMGGNSGAGSYNFIGQFKAEIVNGFVQDNNVQTVIEFGFGDGQQLSKAQYPKYIGLDVSETIMEKTSKRFEGDPAKEFRLYDGHSVPGLIGDLTLSFDVIYHLVEDEVYHNYMDALFAASSKYVIVYSSNIDGWHGAAHVLHRNNTKYIANTFPTWKFLGSLKNKYAEKTAQDFFFYAKCM
eukprot:m.69943 g.69943  ORF g.69943 m.69943 type:complete len:354 (+) comp24161_c0_seq1:358-1419(+)